MGKHAQRRLIRKLDLELFLSKVEPQPSPKVDLEQYTISEVIAATMLYIAAYNNNDIIGKTVVDFGCGTGRLALGAAYLGAESVLGIDIDKDAVKTALNNGRKLGLLANTQLIFGDIRAVKGQFDTVLQNPPFGVQTRGADRAFLLKALEVGKSIYSLHNHPQVDKELIRRLKSSKDMIEVSPSPFIKRLIEENNGVIRGVYALLMTIPRMFSFHTKIKHDFVIDLYTITRKDPN